MHILTKLVAMHSGIDCCRIWPRLGILDDSLFYWKLFHVGSVPVMFKNDVYVGSSLGFGTELRFLTLNSLVMRFVLFGNDLHRTYRALLLYALWFSLRYRKYFGKCVNVSPSPSSRLSSGLEHVTHSALACLRLYVFEAVCSNCQTVLNEASLLLWLPATGVLSVSQSAACVWAGSGLDSFLCASRPCVLLIIINITSCSFNNRQRPYREYSVWTTSLKFTANWVSSPAHSFTLHLSAWQNNVSLTQSLSLFLRSRHLQPFAYTPPPYAKVV